MTYRECYAQIVQAQHLVDDVHLRHCPSALRDFGVNAPDTRFQLGCPHVHDDIPIPDDWKKMCAACWDKEMEARA